MEENQSLPHPSFAPFIIKVTTCIYIWLCSFYNTFRKRVWLNILFSFFSSRSITFGNEFSGTERAISYISTNAQMYSYISIHQLHSDCCWKNICICMCVCIHNMDSYYIMLYFISLLHYFLRNSLFGYILCFSFEHFGLLWLKNFLLSKMNK